MHYISCILLTVDEEEAVNKRQRAKRMWHDDGAEYQIPCISFSFLIKLGVFSYSLGHLPFISSSVNSDRIGADDAYQTQVDDSAVIRSYVLLSFDTIPATRTCLTTSRAKSLEVCSRFTDYHPNAFLAGPGANSFMIPRRKVDT